MGELRDRVDAALDGPAAKSVYECAHCGFDNDGWQDDCPECGGVLMRIVTDSREDDSTIAR